MADLRGKILARLAILEIEEAVHPEVTPSKSNASPHSEGRIAVRDQTGAAHASDRRDDEWVIIEPASNLKWTRMVKIIRPRCGLIGRQIMMVVTDALLNGLPIAGRMLTRGTMKQFGKLIKSAAKKNRKRLTVLSSID